MQIKRVVAAIKEAEHGTRFLDAQIALCLGWTRGMSKVRGHQVWTRPGSSKPAKVPMWSTDLNDAYHLAQSIYPNHVGGFIWKNGRGVAQVGEAAEQIEAADPVLALCAAALSAIADSDSL